MFSMEWSCDSAGINLLIDEQRVRPADVEKQLKNAFHKYLAKKLAAKPDQGKVFKVASLSSASNHFLKNGNFTRFAEWRFIHKARLNVVPLRGSLKFNIGSKSCRKCEYPNETLAHVLNHCGTHMVAATKRHNAVAGRLEKVLPRNDHTSVYINQAVPGSNSDLRPDITVIDEKNRIATIIDIAIPFKSSKVAMEEARRRKKEKNAGIERSLKERGFKTFCDAFVIGSLGSYDPANNACIRRLQIPHRYATLMRRLMICDVIRWSRNIYVEHLSGIRQYTDGQPPTTAPHRRLNHNC
uniref:Reverse transcriptase n=1 Tax=Panagrellus redivivus TaxID=6233 RepID=A0A7E4V2A8_PANRE